MRAHRLLHAFALIIFCFAASSAFADETNIKVGAIDAVLTTPTGVDRPPVVALLIAGSGSVDRDGNGPQLKPATLKKLAEQLAAHGVASLRYDKRGAKGWKPQFGKPEDFRFKDYVDDAVSLVEFLRGKFTRVVVVGHSEGGLVAILTARRIPVDRVVLMATTARPLGVLLKAQLEKKLPPDKYEAAAKAIDSIMAGQIVDPPPEGLPIAPAMQPSIASSLIEDPIDPLKELIMPILIVAGGRDRLLPRVDMLALSAAASAAKTFWLPDMNRVLVDVTDDDDDQKSYNDAARPLDPDMVEGVSTFIAGAAETPR